jgi:hypothetical protein
MIQLILNDEHLASALGTALAGCRRRLFISTADVKNLRIPLTGQPSRGGRGGFGGKAPSIIEMFQELSARKVDICLLHAGVPSENFLEELKADGVPKGLTMRRCPRVHAKAIIADGKTMYLGSANLTGAGLGAKSSRRRNFEAGIWTDELALIDPVLDMLQSIWDSAQCSPCDRKAHCPCPLEEPNL